jgi:hypothetical protein
MHAKSVALEEHLKKMRDRHRHPIAQRIAKGEQTVTKVGVFDLDDDVATSLKKAKKPV